MGGMFLLARATMRRPDGCIWGGGLATRTSSWNVVARAKNNLHVPGYQFNSRLHMLHVWVGRPWASEVYGCWQWGKKPPKGSAAEGKELVSLLVLGPWVRVRLVTGHVKTADH